MKKFKSIMLILTLTLGLTACGGEKTPLISQEEAAHDYGIQPEIIQTFADGIVHEQIPGLTLDDLSRFTDDEFDALSQDIAYYSIKISGLDFYKAVVSYESAMQEMGEITIPEGAVNTYEISEDEMIITLPLVGTDINSDGEPRTGNIQLIYNDNFHITSATTNVNLTLKESMVKAGQNTLIGMGTVFIMLILMSFIISGMKVIPALQAAFEKKKSGDEDVTENVTEVTPAEEPAEAEETDDTELIAVIAAAIAASEGAASTDGFVVRSIRRIR